MSRFQFVWWWPRVMVGGKALCPVCENYDPLDADEVAIVWRRWCWGFERLLESETALAQIYRWRLYLGPLEIRRWTEFAMANREARR